MRRFITELLHEVNRATGFASAFTNLRTGLGLGRNGRAQPRRDPREADLDRGRLHTPGDLQGSAGPHHRRAPRAANPSTFNYEAGSSGQVYSCVTQRTAFFVWRRGARTSPRTKQCRVCAGKRKTCWAKPRPPPVRLWALNDV